ncbi:MAG TPA: hypothetical protein VF543_06250 [Pyrinomonadaceae bacterium]|jgi:hypothetical protein
MKREVTRFSMMVVIVMLVTQLYGAIPVSQAFQSDNRPQRRSMRIDPQTEPGTRTGQRGGQNWCYRRCRREYSRCLSYAGRSWGRRRACAIRYRNCVRRCA